MSITFHDAREQDRGLFFQLLVESYSPLLKESPNIWKREVPGWRAFDASVFEQFAGVGACTFLTRLEGKVVGFGSFDPHPTPAYAVVGHNCIRPAFRSRGYGRAQIEEIFRRCRERETRRIQVTTCDHEFFRPAQRMYLACGFREVRRRPSPDFPFLRFIDYWLHLTPAFLT